MYEGKKLTREQIVFVADAIISAAFDRVESGLPPCTPKSERESDETALIAYERGATESAAMALATLYAQITGEGIGITDIWVMVIGDAVDDFIAECLKRDGRTLEPGALCSPVAIPFAEKFADFVFEDEPICG